jgi:Fic family protein
MNKRWIWEFDGYPNFTYDRKELDSLIENIIFLQGSLSSTVSFVSKEILEEKLKDSYADEIINSSAIEGEFLNRESVRKSIAKKLGFDRFANTDYVTDGLVNILVDACTNYEKDLDIERIFKWHAAIFPTGRNNKGEVVNVGLTRGDYEMIIGGGGIKEIIYYQAPPHNELVDHLVEFFDWFNKTEDSIIKAAISHLWFLIIHPLDDGNGRIARTICEYVLARVEKSYYSKIYSVSKTIYENKKGYYEILEQTTGFKIKENPLDITAWLKFFLQTLLKSLQEAEIGLQYIKEKTNFWDKYRDKELNSRQIKVLNKILDIGSKNFEGGLTKRKYVAIAKTSTSTATNDLKQLVDLGCIKQTPGTVGKSTSYFINILF